jgi:hypothetical protein
VSWQPDHAGQPQARFLSPANLRGELFVLRDQTRHKTIDELWHYLRSVDAFRDYIGSGSL